jgi:toxin ParE1/3/4
MRRWDLSDIRDYTLQVPSSYAEQLIERLITKTKLMTSFPKVGRQIPEYHDENMREVVEGRYRILYELINSERVDITHICHTSRPLPSLP